MSDLQKELETRVVRMNEHLNRDEFEAVGETYTEGATLLAHKQAPVVGRQAIVEVLRKIGPTYKRIMLEQFFYFKQTGANSAYTNDYTKSVDDFGNTTGTYHGTRLWKKEGGNWCIDREFFNHRSPTVTSKEAVKKHIEGRISSLCCSINTGSYDCVACMYTEGATLIPHEGDICTGREDIRKKLKVVIPTMRTIHIEETCYFELLNDVTAYTNCNMRSVDENGETKFAFRNCLLWTKVGDEWYVDRDTYNDRPVPEAAE